MTFTPKRTGAPKVLCIGLNYQDHAAEANLQLPATPIVVAKFASSLAGPEDEIVLPPDDQMVYYEARARGGHRPSGPLDERRGRARSPGRNCGLQRCQPATCGWPRAKGDGPRRSKYSHRADPALLTLNEIADVQDLAVRASINDEVVQSGTTADMVVSVAEVIAHLARVMTLMPGDIIATGPPDGAGMGWEAALLLAAGDIVEVEVEVGGVGLLRNPGRQRPMIAAREGAHADRPL